MTGFLGKYKKREMRFYRGWFTQILVCFIVKDSSKTLEVLRLFSLLLCSFSSSFPFLYSSCYFAFKGLRPSTQQSWCIFWRVVILPDLRIPQKTITIVTRRFHKLRNSAGLAGGFLLSLLERPIFNWEGEVYCEAMCGNDHPLICATSYDWSTPWKINMLNLKMEVWFRFFLPDSSWVIVRWTSV